MMVSKFGQSVRLVVLDENKKTIFSTSGLRVDFFIQIIPDWNMAKFTIYNLSPETVKQISNGERYVKLYTQLHDGPVQELPYDFYVNNSLTYKLVPNALTELYCVGGTKKTFTDKQVQMKVSNPKLERYCDELAKAAKSDVVFKYTDFPPNILDYTPISPQATWSGTVIGALRKLGRQYSFTVNEEAGNILNLIFQPNTNNQEQSGQNKRAGYILNTSNMRSNPRVGIAKIEINSNLDFNIRAGTILDTSKLLTVESVDGFKVLAILNNAMQSAMSGNSRYSTLSVEHSGSNYDDMWHTKAMAMKASQGNKMSQEDCPEDKK